MRVAGVQFDILWEDKPANHAEMERLLEQAAIDAGTVVVLPELGDTGFSFDLDAIINDTSLEWARGVAERRGIWLQAGFARLGPDGRGRNCAALVAPDGSLRGEYQKLHPFTIGREAEHYTGGDALCVLDVDGVAVCPLICYDLRFPEIWRLGAAAGAEVFTIGASWPKLRQHHWRSLLVARAIENQAYVVAVNRVGSDPSSEYDGGSMIISPQGDILAEAADSPAVLTATLDLDALRKWRESFPALRDVRRELLGTVDVSRSCADGDTDRDFK